jgi:monothiol glutaredoxin
MRDINKEISDIVKSSSLVLFMKGSRDFPQCGFSAAVIKILQDLNVDFADINVLDDMEIRQGIKEYTDWPTIPQLYANGEFVGGCDIITEMFQSGELSNLLSKK